MKTSVSVAVAVLKKNMDHYDPISDVDTLRSCLYSEMMNRAKGLSGPQVLKALKEISEEMYASGLDAALHKAEVDIKEWDNIASAWDLTWLTLLATRLHKMKIR